MQVNQEFQLPIGYRFKPTDQELIIHYLSKRVYGQPLLSNAVTDRNVYEVEPWRLIDGVNEKEAYFFTCRTKRGKRGNSLNRTAGCGYWKATRGDDEINNSENGVIGYKKSLVFSIKDDPEFAKNSKKNSWIMHEYRLSISKTVDEWVICRIKKRGDEDISYKDETHNETILPFTDRQHHDRQQQQQQQLMLHDPMAPSSLSSSWIEYLPHQFMGEEGIGALNEAPLLSTNRHHHHHHHDKKQKQVIVYDTMAPSSSSAEHLPHLCEEGIEVPLPSTNHHHHDKKQKQLMLYYPTAPIEHLHLQSMGEETSYAPPPCSDSGEPSSLPIEKVDFEMEGEDEEGENFAISFARKLLSVGGAHQEESELINNTFAMGMMDWDDPKSIAVTNKVEVSRTQEYPYAPAWSKRKSQKRKPRCSPWTL